MKRHIHINLIAAVTVLLATTAVTMPLWPIPMLTVSVDEVLSKRGTGQEELRELVLRGEIPLPADRRHVGASRQIALRMLERAQKLGVAKLVP